MNRDKIQTAAAPDIAVFDFADKWIVSRLYRTIRDLNAALDNFRINDATKIIYDFIWHDYCDWYVEMVKERLYQEANETARAIIIANAISVFEKAIKLLHPFMPFITDELYSLTQSEHEKSITVAEFPEAEMRFVSDRIESEMDLVQEVVTSIRAVRKEANVPPNAAVDVVVKPKDEQTLEILSGNQLYIRRLAKVESFSIGFDLDKPDASASTVVRGTEIFVSLEGLVNIEAERGRLEKEIARVKGVVSEIEAKLNNEQFIKRAPAQVIDKEKMKIESMKLNLSKLEENYQLIR